MKHLSWITLLLCLLQFSSCTIEKRRYTSGYHVDWHHNENKAQQKKLELEKETTPTEAPALATADLGNELTQQDLKSEVPVLFSPKAFAKATANETKRRIEKINFLGHKFWQKTKSTSVDPELEAEARFAKKTNTALYLTIFGYVGGFLSAIPQLQVLGSALALMAFVALIAGFVIAAGCLKEIKREPKYTKYYSRAFAAWLLGLIYLILLVVAFILILLFLLLLVASF